MSQPYVGEIRMFGGNFAPVDWMMCEGQLLPISQYQTLYSLIGTTYGGDGQSTFALPDLRGRVPIHSGNGAGGNYTLGETGGVETVTLTVNQIPAHTHMPIASTKAGQNTPAGSLWATLPLSAYQTDTTNLQPMNTSAIDPVGGSQPHENMMPYLSVNFIISLYGVYPSST
ncbi:phage tail protein [Brevibacillus fluminis]|uniref:Phage tail protein n=1 Tax=Brevibacillus fluminis TaxID=511487 RepID=A0A3M8CVK2_9BACL|nr:tail fiber protein [Brevibacillus fluminis]RNB79529.1 phage tail protein [Brevibacillus fluminis]